MIFVYILCSASTGRGSRLRSVEPYPVFLLLLLQDKICSCSRIQAPVWCKRDHRYRRPSQGTPKYRSDPEPFAISRRVDPSFLKNASKISSGWKQSRLNPVISNKLRLSRVRIQAINEGLYMSIFYSPPPTLTRSCVQQNSRQTLGLISSPFDVQPDQPPVCFVHLPTRRWSSKVQQWAICCSRAFTCTASRLQLTSRQRSSWRGSKIFFLPMLTWSSGG